MYSRSEKPPTKGLAGSIYSCFYDRQIRNPIVWITSKVVNRKNPGTVRNTENPCRARKTGKMGGFISFNETTGHPAGLLIKAPC
jgi:hypothetical protein